MEHKIDLVVNTFERTYRDVLKHGFFTNIETQNKRKFTRKIALINNVQNRDEATALAKKLVNLGELDAFYFVDELLAKALKQSGLTQRDLGRIPHYSDCALVAVTLPGSPWLVYWDAEVRLQEPVNWIDPSIALMESNRQIVVANPNWWLPGLEKETFVETGDFALGYGFSDALFLIRREDFLLPIYRESCPVSLRYPLAHVARVFEQRVDAYMRNNRRLRATYKQATYVHPENYGAAYPDLSTPEKVKKLRNYLLIKVLQFIPTNNPRWSIYPNLFGKKR
ncbi:MAG TPA: hypothetical protein VHQ46_02195 [Desulfobacteria bacterium]|nr:hypothetical protein [Desulfobacteria bacterium]